MIILDFGSGNTCLNQESIISDMIYQFIKVDSHKHEIVIKWQLFEKAGDNIPLTHACFVCAYRLAEKYGYETTASVFDINSLKFLLRFNIPFVKIANRPDLYYLANKIEDGLRIIKSVGSLYEKIDATSYNEKKILDGEYIFDDNCLCCISKYPATMKEYEKIFGEKELRMGISDHTTDCRLYKKYQPKLYECHYALENSEGLDAGPFARRPKQLKEII